MRIREHNDHRPRKRKIAKLSDQRGDRQRPLPL
jgi:hypothetical protein